MGRRSARCVPTTGSLASQRPRSWTGCLAWPSRSCRCWRTANSPGRPSRFQRPRRPLRLVPQGAACTNPVRRNLARDSRSVVCQTPALHIRFPAPGCTRRLPISCLLLTKRCPPLRQPPRSHPTLPPRMRACFKVGAWASCRDLPGPLVRRSWLGGPSCRWCGLKCRFLAEARNGTPGQERSSPSILCSRH